MFESVVVKWDYYINQRSVGWGEDDCRNGLGVEIKDRLGQLDILLEYIEKALRVIRSDPHMRSVQTAWVIENVGRIGVDLTQEEFIRMYDELGPKIDYRDCMRAFSEIKLFTESFYFVAWRLIKAFDGDPKRFPGVKALRVKGITMVRNHLLQHPEKHGSNHFQSLVITSAGPVLKANSVIVNGSAGFTKPVNEHIDRGLYANAEELRDVLLASITD